MIESGVCFICGFHLYQFLLHRLWSFDACMMTTRILPRLEGTGLVVGTRRESFLVDQAQP